MPRRPVYALAIGLTLLAARLLRVPLRCRLVRPATERRRIPVSFRNDVMAVLSKAGCNAGACHGNKSGKGGFKLSLRGQDPGVDYDTLTRDLFARRTNPLDPDQSLILLKPTAQVPHEGGLRFKKDSQEYDILRSWIEQGTPKDAGDAPVLQRLEVSPPEQVLVEPADRVQVHATAVFSDGSRARRHPHGGLRAIDRAGEDLARRPRRPPAARRGRGRRPLPELPGDRPPRVRAGPARSSRGRTCRPATTSTSRSSPSCARCG